jgi:hypothetical protein
VESGSGRVRAALVAGMLWLEVYCPGCQTIRALDIRTIDRHPLASVGSLVPGSAPMSKIMGLHALPPAVRVQMMAKLTMPTATAAGLTVRERVLLYCAASGTDWQHAGVRGEQVTTMVVKGTPGPGDSFGPARHMRRLGTPQRSRRGHYALAVAGWGIACCCRCSTLLWGGYVRATGSGSTGRVPSVELCFSGDIT